MDFSIIIALENLEVDQIDALRQCNQQEAQWIGNIFRRWGADVKKIHQKTLTKYPVLWTERHVKGTKTQIATLGPIRAMKFQPNFFQLDIFKNLLSVKILMEETQAGGYGD